MGRVAKGQEFYSGILISSLIDSAESVPSGSHFVTQYPAGIAESSASVPADCDSANIVNCANLDFLSKYAHLTI